MDLITEFVATCVQGNFEESDEQFRLISRGGRKRKCPVIETLLRKKVTPPSELDPMMCEGPEYLSWLLNAESENLAMGDALFTSMY